MTYVPLAKDLLNTLQSCTDTELEALVKNEENSFFMEDIEKIDPSVRRPYLRALLGRFLHTMTAGDSLLGALYKANSPEELSTAQAALDQFVENSTNN